MPAAIAGGRFVNNGVGYDADRAGIGTGGNEKSRGRARQRGYKCQTPPRSF
jgi:hypothetical protein